MDSFKATSIVKLLSKLAKQGKTIVSTIHQPNSESYSFFDRLILMMDGSLAYQGFAKDCPKYFASVGYEFPSQGNPADQCIKLLSCNYPKTIEDQEKVEKLVRAYDDKLSSNVEKQMDLLKLPAPEADNRKKISSYREFMILLERMRVFTLHNPRAARSRMFTTIIVGFIIGACYSDISLGEFVNSAYLSDQLGLLYLLVMQTFVLNL